MNLKCPLCNETLFQEPKQYRCQKGHQFDRAKSGYVNVLQSQRLKTKSRGDDKAMVDARSAFLDAGYYDVFRQALASIVLEEKPESVLDVGCGEGWYATPFVDNIESVAGIDISKVAVEKASKRHQSMTLAVASSKALPFLDASFDVVYCVFAPFDLDEIERVLKPGGLFIDVFALEDHLLELKEVLYPTVYQNEIKIYETDAFCFEGIKRVETVIEDLNQKHLQDLFAMTPYAHRTPKKGLDALASLEKLSVRVGFGFGVYRRTKNQEVLRK